MEQKGSFLYLAEAKNSKSSVEESKKQQVEELGMACKKYQHMLQDGWIA